HSFDIFFFLFVFFLGDSFSGWVVYSHGAALVTTLLDPLYFFQLVASRRLGFIWNLNLLLAKSRKILLVTV
ncbi:hypothetical protein PJP10_31705, partial [Mycobacterium kansasii]